MSSSSKTDGGTETVLACQFPFPAAFVIAEMRSTRYHGIFAPRLNEYLKGHVKNTIKLPETR